VRSLRTGFALGSLENKARHGRARNVPRVARLLALAHKFQGMPDRGEVESMAELARLGRVSRARITQIMDLLMLAPEIQEEILCRGAEVSLRELLVVAHETVWQEQREAWRRCAAERDREAA
jgi:hypothetical protein